MFNKKFVLLLALITVLVTITQSYPLDEDQNYPSPGAHQLASWIVSQLRAKDYIAVPDDVPVMPYRIRLHGKRNSEMSNAIIGSEETQKMYRAGRK